jgi:hypothetical protein
MIAMYVVDVMQGKSGVVADVGGRRPSCVWPVPRAVACTLFATVALFWQSRLGVCA